MTTGNKVHALIKLGTSKFTSEAHSSASKAPSSSSPPTSVFVERFNAIRYIIDAATFEVNPG